MCSKPYDAETVKVTREPPRQQEALRAWVQFARSYARFTRRMEQVFACHGMTGPQFDVLATLNRCGNITQQELAAELLVTKGNVSGVLDRLEALAWIERRPDTQDRRANRLHLTASGRDKLTAVVPDHHTLIRETMAGFQPEDFRTFIRLLRLFEEGLEE